MTVRRVRRLVDPAQEQLELPAHARRPGLLHLGMQPAAVLSLLRSADRSARADVLTHLQRSVGNTAVLKVVQRQTPPPNSSPAPTVADDSPKDPGYQESAAAPSFRVRIVAHASPRWRGTHSNKDADAKNLELSQKRAERVRQLVVEQFAKEFPNGVSVNADIETVTDQPQPGTIGVHTDAHGSKDSLADAKGNRSDDAQKHRRVDVFVTSDKQISGSASASKPGETRSTDSKFWYVRITEVSGGSYGAGVFLILLELTNAATGDTVKGRVFPALGPGVKGSIGTSKGSGSPTSFSTNRAVNFKNFQKNFINFTFLGFNLLHIISYDRAYFNFTRLGDDAKDIDVSGISGSIGTSGLEGATVFGFLTLEEPFPPKEIWIEHSDETSIPYQRNEHGEDSHSVLFGTEHFDVSDLEAEILKSFLSSVAAARR